MELDVIIDFDGSIVGWGRCSLSTSDETETVVSVETDDLEALLLESDAETLPNQGLPPEMAVDLGVIDYLDYFTWDADAEKLEFDEDYVREVWDGIEFDDIGNWHDEDRSVAIRYMLADGFVFGIWTDTTASFYEADVATVVDDILEHEGEDTFIAISVHYEHFVDEGFEYLEGSSAASLWRESALADQFETHHGLGEPADEHIYYEHESQGEP